MKEPDYSTYIKTFARLFDAYDAVLPYLEAGEDFKSFVERKRQWLERLKTPEFPVAFLGAFSAGKSTIINAILGEDILPQATKSFTAIPTLISRGKSNRGVVHYLDEAAREELKNLYLEEISKELRRPVGEYAKLERGELLRRLEKDIEQRKTQMGAFGKQKFFEELKTLIQGWKKLKGAVKEISLAELPHYVTEEYEDILLVDRVEIFLTEANLPESVVLVDLPGLGVVNPRHRKLTKSYVENDAKAFVIAMKVFHLLEGEEIELLAEIHGQRKRVLQRAFWVINQWDLLTAQQKKEEQAHFEQKIEHYGFHIAKDRVFHVSALNYLLLRLIADGRLEKSGKTGEHVDTLQKALGKIPARGEAETYLQSLEEARDFAQFRAALFDYLAHTAKVEFLHEARSEYLEMASRLRDKLEPLYQLYRHKNDESMRNAFIAGELSRRQDEVLRRLRETVREHIRVLRTDLLPELVFWRDEDQARLAAQIEKAFDTLDRKLLKNELLKGLDLNSVVSRLPHKIEENLHIQQVFRAQLQALLDDQVVRQHLARLLDAITAVDMVPEEMLAALRDRLSGRDLVNRLKGMCDVFLFHYGDVIDELGRSILNRLGGEEVPNPQDVLEALRRNADAALEVAKSLNLVGANDTVKQMLALGVDKLAAIYQALAGAKKDAALSRQRDDIDYALDHYKRGLLDYARGQREQINKYARRGIKNYFEELEEDLLHFFDAHKSHIAKVIMRQLSADIDVELQAELDKQRIIKEAYHEVYQVVSVRAV
ncbi:dynamin family protein [Candidatus Methylocalor cossyra]